MLDPVRAFAEIDAGVSAPTSYWLDVPLLPGTTAPPPREAGIVIIGSGLSGASVAYFLQQAGLTDLLVLDDCSPQAATYRNAGHILYGTVESMHAMVQLHGEAMARAVWAFSIECCHAVRETIAREDIDAEYRQDGYLVLAVSDVEDAECRSSVALLNRMGFPSEYWDADRVRALGFRSGFGARFEAGSAQAHPVKFRNGLLRRVLERGARYHSDVRVTAIDGDSGGAVVHTVHGPIRAEAVVIAANAYSPLFSGFFRERGLIEPFRGNIIVSAPLAGPFPVTYPHSFDHGYEYGLLTADRRLLLGGWRQHSASGEIGTYSLAINREIEAGLQRFAREMYTLTEPLCWDYSWAGIMAASKTGLPFIGATTTDRIYACCGYTGHGFSWAHGSARLLVDAICGHPLPDVAPLFNPRGQR